MHKNISISNFTPIIGTASETCLIARVGSLVIVSINGYKLPEDHITAANILYRQLPRAMHRSINYLDPGYLLYVDPGSTYLLLNAPVNDQSTIYGSIAYLTSE